MDSLCLTQHKFAIEMAQRSVIQYFMHKTTNDLIWISCHQILLCTNINSEFWLMEFNKVLIFHFSHEFFDKECKHWLTQ